MFYCSSNDLVVFGFGNYLTFCDFAISEQEEWEFEVFYKKKEKKKSLFFTGILIALKFLFLLLSERICFADIRRVFVRSIGLDCDPIRTVIQSNWLILFFFRHWITIGLESDHDPELSAVISLRGRISANCDVTNVNKNKFR